MKILVTDDDPIVLESCRRILVAEGHTVFLATGAVEALRIVGTESPELALVDVVMPKYDGTCLTMELRARRPDLRVVVMSGYPTAETVARGVRSGAACFLPKPFTPDELLETVRGVPPETPSA